jgi:uncharacterized protein (DUF58 family)
MNGLRLLFLAAFIYFLALATGQHELYYIGYVLGAVTLGSLIWARLNLSAVEIERGARVTSLQVGQIFEETLTLSNQSFFPKLWVEVRDRSNLPGHRTSCVMSLAGNQRKSWRVRTVCRQRGVYKLGPVVMVTGDPFGLFRFWRRKQQVREVLVYPPLLDLGAFGLPSTELSGGSQVRSRSFNLTPNAVGIREYLPGDPYNRIHWPASARQQRLMVKEFELDPTSDIWILLDMEMAVQFGNPTAVPAIPKGQDGEKPDPRASQDYIGDTLGQPVYLPPSTEEYAVAVAASLAGRLLGDKRAVGLIAWGQHHEVLNVDRGSRQLLRILRTLASVKAQGRSPIEEVIAAESSRFSRGSTVIVITPSVDEKWARSLGALTQRGIKGAAIIVEPATFTKPGEHQPHNSMLAVGTLAAVGVPSYLVKHGGPINVALAQGLGGVKVIR